MQAAEVLATQCVVRPARAGWLATSTPGSAWRIGVIGLDEEDARMRFAEARIAWARLREKPEPKR